VIARWMSRLVAEEVVPAHAGDAPRWHAPPSPPPSPAAVAPGGAEFGIDIAALFHLLRRRWHVAVLVTLVLTMIAAALIIRLPNQYTAQALVVLNLRLPKIAELASSTGTLLSRSQTDISVVETEMQVMRSARLLRKLVLQLDLLNDPSFTADPKGPSLATRIKALLARLHLPGGSPAPAGDAVVPIEALVQRAVVNLSQMIELSNDGGSYAIGIVARSDDAQLSARLANGLAEIYLTEQAREQREARASASAWLSERLKAMRAEVLANDRALESYRAQHQLGKNNQQSLVDSRLDEVNTALIAAQTNVDKANTDVADAEAALRRGDLSSISSVLTSPTIQALREQEAGILVKVGQLKQTLLPKHPERLAAEAQLQAVRQSINIQVQRVVGNLREKQAEAKGALESLRRQLAQLEQQRRAQAAPEAELAQLSRNAEVSRDVYGEFLREFNTTLAEAEGPSTDARLAARAEPPLDASGPKRKLLLMGAGVASAITGVLLAIGLGFWRGGFGGALPLEQTTGLPNLEILPELRRRDLRASLKPGPRPPASGSVRSLAVTLERRVPRRRGGPMVLLSSAEAGEGKSMLTLSLARVLAQQERRVMIVDLDFWRSDLQRLAPSLGLEPTAMRLGPAILMRDPSARLDAVVCDRAQVPDDKPEAVREVLRAVRACRESYDLILLDAPPLLAIPEALLAATAADAMLLLVRFERTRAATLRQALHKLATVGVVPVGTVLTRVNPRAHRRYGYDEMAYGRSA
jgi:uncharacterized protein involved in exopolysaccharide biosynthesis/Mrp family chromosome partitioning ATPase